MQKVISALEHLEKLAATRDQEKETIDTLRTTISHLELEDTKKKEETQRNAKVSLDETSKSEKLLKLVEIFILCSVIFKKFHKTF